MQIPILKQDDHIVAAIQPGLTDADFAKLREDLLGHVDKYRSKGVILDVTALPVIDAFGTRMIRNLVQMVRLHGASAVVVGIQPDVAFEIVRLGLDLGDVASALDLEGAQELLRRETP